MDKLKELLERIPFTMVLIAGLGYVGYGFYQFKYSPDSGLTQKTAESERISKENTDIDKRIKSAREFYRTLDQKRMELRQLAQQLDEMKATLTDQLDVPFLVKLFVTEAAKVGLTVVSIRPGQTKVEDYYAYQSFNLDFRAVYVQLLVFLERLSTVERIVRIETLNATPSGSQTSQYVELSGSIELKAYKYIGSKADTLGRSEGDASAGAPGAPGGPGTPAGGAKQ
jgi:Tfp pilus assembly protein PilO